MKALPPGDDQLPVPPPVNEVPPHDRFCDLVMTGGVASGVVYPWAIVEIARAYRFRNIGGTSVGAMAAALAAAAEYGRRTGHDESFEVLRRLPAALGEDMGQQQTRMLSLFQTDAKGQRLIKLWGQIGRGLREPLRNREPGEPPRPLKVSLICALGKVLSAYRRSVLLGAVAGAALLPVVWLLSGRGRTAGALASWLLSLHGAVSLFTLLCLSFTGALVGLIWALWLDIRHGLVENNLGLCKGGTQKGPDAAGNRRPGLVEWLHDGVQASAGLRRTARPLTFRDLWNAPDRPGAAHQSCDENAPARCRAINLQMITTNVTHGRPYRLPLADSISRLFFKPEELKDYFPKIVLDALVTASRPYERSPLNGSDPETIQDAHEFRELPGADLPIVVAARLSLSFPLLFAAVPLWAIDYEADLGQRQLRRCLFTDGGASSNFPIHLFDNAIPRWPTFGLWLDRRDPGRPKRKKDENQDVWLPKYAGDGWGDNWNRFDPQAVDPGSAGGPADLAGCRKSFKFLGRFLLALLTGALNWQDRTNMRLPHVRNRVARLWLERGEGGLHIGMSRAQILDMAHRYGTATGQLFVERFKERHGHASGAWREQRWVRLTLLINGLQERLEGLKASAEWAAGTVPLARAIGRAEMAGPIRRRRGGSKLDEEQGQSLAAALAELEQLEESLGKIKPQSYRPVPAPELRLRAPL